MPSTSTRKRGNASSRAAGWHREDIKAAIRKRGSTLAEISRDAGLCEDAGRIALTRPWPRVEAVIAAFLGVKPQTIWPDRYRERGAAR